MTQKQIKKNYKKQQIKFMKAKTEAEKHRAAIGMSFWRIKDQGAVDNYVKSLKG